MTLEFQKQDVVQLSNSNLANSRFKVAALLRIFALLFES